MQDRFKRILRFLRDWVTGGQTLEVKGSVDKFESIDSPVTSFVFGLETVLYQVTLDDPITTPTGVELTKVPVRFETGTRIPNADGLQVVVSGVYDGYDYIILGNRMSCARIGYSATALRRMNVLVALAIALIYCAAGWYAGSWVWQMRESPREFAVGFFNKNIYKPQAESIKNKCDRISAVTPEAVAPGTPPRWELVTDVTGKSERVDMNVEDNKTKAYTATVEARAACIRLELPSPQSIDAQWWAFLAAGSVMVLALVMAILIFGFFVGRVAGLSIWRLFYRWTRRLTEYSR